MSQALASCENSASNSADATPTWCRGAWGLASDLVGNGGLDSVVGGGDGRVVGFPFGAARAAPVRGQFAACAGEVDGEVGEDVEVADHEGMIVRRRWDCRLGQGI